MIDLRTCNPGDKLISKHGSVYEYVSPTPYGVHTYLDHVLRPVVDRYGNKCSNQDSLVTRTDDGYAFALNRDPNDEDIVKIIKPIQEKFKLLCEQ